MFTRITHRLREVYVRHVVQSIETTPDHVAVIQDGNRRYARERGLDPSDGHVHGAETTEELLHWCEEFGISEVTLYTFSTENFSRPDDELESLFELLREKLYSFADADLIHDNEVRIHGIGELQRLPDEVYDAITYAEERTAQYNSLKLNIALAYGGRNELRRTAQQLTQQVANGDLAPEDITVDTVESELYREPIREVDLVIRTGGNERTSNFLPWQANGNEAAVYFCTPYWPAFSRLDFVRALRTYEAREKSWQQTRTQRAIALANVLATQEYHEYEAFTSRIRDRLTETGKKMFDQATQQVSESKNRPNHSDD